MITVRVPLSDRSYDVLVGHGAVTELAALLPPLGPPGGARHPGRDPAGGRPGHAVRGVRDRPRGGAQVAGHHRVPQPRLRPHGPHPQRRGDRRGRRHGDRCRRVRRRRLASRRPGGARATTLLGMVDAAIGGKTGVNLPIEGKNLVGAFWQPSGVVCDLDALATLPPREVRCGRGEMAKYHFLTGDDLLAMDETERIARCVQIKAEIVAADEREGGRRALLNYGHTLAHALEIATDHPLAHGEAVAVGLVYAAHLAEPSRPHRRRPRRAALRRRGRRRTNSARPRRSPICGRSGRPDGPGQEGARRRADLRARRARRGRGGAGRRRRRPWHPRRMPFDATGAARSPTRRSPCHHPGLPPREVASSWSPGSRCASRR